MNKTIENLTIFFKKHKDIIFYILKYVVLFYLIMTALDWFFDSNKNKINESFDGLKKHVYSEQSVRDVFDYYDCNNMSRLIETEDECRKNCKLKNSKIFSIRIVDDSNVFVKSSINGKDIFIPMGECTVKNAFNWRCHRTELINSCVSEVVTQRVKGGVITEEVVCGHDISTSSCLLSNKRR